MMKFKNLFIGATVALMVFGCDQVHETWEQPEFVSGSDAGAADSTDSGTVPECETDKDCNDNNECTVEACKSGECVFAKKADGMECDDGEPCTIPDVCKDGACKGIPGKCDDNNPCTADTCLYGADSPDTACQFLPTVGDCEDGNECTVGDTCEGGKCKSGINTCECSTDADCASKEDGNLCNGKLTCNQGKCIVDQLTVVTCEEDNDPCTKVSCDQASGLCKNHIDSSMVGKACAEGKVCMSSGVCQEPDPEQDPCDGKDCNDNNVCTTDSCKEGVCVYEAKSGDCNDGDLCTENDSCIAGACKGAAVTCEDGNTCTTNSCDPSKGCVFNAAPNGQSCDDGNPFTLGEVCTSGVCKAPIECQFDSHCDDGNVCNGMEKCIAGICKPGNALNCDDGASCTTDSCDPKKGCMYEADDSKCSEGYCYAAVYSWSMVKPGCYQCDPSSSYDNAGYCDDNNECTSDICNDGACKHLSKSTGWWCDDGDPCTVSSSCVDGTCKGTAKDCDDYDASTSDYCDAESGVCKHDKLPQSGTVEVYLTGFTTAYQVYVYHVGLPSNGKALTANFVVLDKSLVCSKGVEFAVEKTGTNLWYGCNPEVPLLSSLTVWVGSNAVTPGFKKSENTCWDNKGEGNLYLSPSQLGCQ